MLPQFSNTDDIVSLIRELDYILRRLDSKNIRPGGITTQAVAPGAVTEDLIHDGAVTEVKVADNAITGAKIVTEAVNQTHVARGNRLVQTVDALPTLPDPAYPQGALALLTLDNKLYRSTGTEWTAAVPTTDLAGEIDGSWIVDYSIVDTKILAGQITEAKMKWTTHLLY